MRSLGAACVLGVCALIVAAGAPAGTRPLPPLSPAREDALTRALDAGRLSEAEYALHRARSLFALREVRDEFGHVSSPGPRDGTAILRDLALRRSALRGDEARVATRILARPGGKQFACDATRPLCFHWGNQASAGEVAATQATFAEVYDLEVETYGYLRPLPDGTRGGNSKTDIYISDIGPGLFGYCTTDDPIPPPDVYAYCVVDDDFAEFGSSQTPQAFRDVTAAHEFFHAIQFAYDFYEDLWLMEGTAMLMEGQFRPEVDDRIRYLEKSVLTSPDTPVDYGEQGSGFEYGAWIYWRFLVEHFDELDDPLVIRRIWERAAGASTDTDGPGPDTVASNPYSLLATRQVLAGRGASFRRLYAKFARVNRVPATFYAEGASYPSAPAAVQRTMAVGQNTGWSSTTLRHLASSYYSFRPEASVGADATLRLVVNLPRRAYGPEAGVIVRLGGSVTMQRIALDKDGRGAATVAFGGAVERVDLVLTNASTRMRCNRSTAYSCRGIARDDGRTYSYRAVVSS